MVIFYIWKASPATSNRPPWELALLYKTVHLVLWCVKDTSSLINMTRSWLCPKCKLFGHSETFHIFFLEKKGYCTVLRPGNIHWFCKTVHWIAMRYILSINHYVHRQYRNDTFVKPITLQTMYSLYTLQTLPRGCGFSTKTRSTI